MKPIPLILSILVTAVVFGVLNSIPILDYLFCFWWVISGFVAVIIYRAFTKDEPRVMPVHGMFIGLIAGLSACLIANLMVYFFGSLNASTLEQFFIENVFGILWAYIGRQEVNFFFLTLLFSLAFWGLFGLLGGWIGAVVFKKSTAPVSAASALTPTSSPTSSDKVGWILTNTAIVLICVVLFALIPSVWSRIPTKIDPPKKVPAPPQTAVEILGIDISQGFGAADLIIRAGDGNVYIYTWSGEAYQWQPGKLQKEKYDTDCPERAMPIFEASAGKIIACRAAQPSAEFTAADMVAYALSSDGEIWKLLIPQRPDFIMMVSTICLAPVGAVVGLIIVGIRYLLMKLRRRSSA